MEGRVIDCCSLINLYTGWRGLKELASLGATWHVCEAVLGEVQYTREHEDEGAIRDVPIEVGRFIDAGILTLAKVQDDKEMEDFVSFAMEVDDGEAQAISIALNRGYALLTDDHKAARLAMSADVGVTVITTAEVLRRWGALHRANAERLPGIVRRISELARFSPRVDSSDREWWLKLYKA